MQHHPTKAVEVLRLDHDLSEVCFETKELEALCPVTEQPDIYHLKICYEPKGGRVVESKSLKLYLWHFRDVGIFAEDLADRIASDLAAALDPRWITVSVEQNVRGGLTLTAEAGRR